MSMHTRLLWISTLFASSYLSATAQTPCNLVVNGNFENQNLPSGSTQLSGLPYNILNVTNQRDELTNWKSTNTYAPTYYAFNAPAGSITNPNTTSTSSSFTPFQPASGPDKGGTIGLAGNDSGNNMYVTQRLSRPLRNGRDYYASMQVMNSDDSGYAVRAGLNITSTDPAYYNAPRNFTASGNGIYSAGNITSTAWTRIYGVFKFNGATNASASFINIGNFFSGTGQYVTPTNPTYQSPYSYYHYIDEVMLYEIPFAGADVSICSGNIIEIGEGCPIPNAQYAWSTPGLGTFANTIQTSVRPTATTDYTLTVTLPGGNISTSKVRVSVSTAPTIDGGSFYITRYQGCRKYYGITIEAVPNATRYVANVTVAGGGGNSVEGVYEPSNNRVTFQLEIEGSGRQADGVVTAEIPGGPCNAQPLTLSQVLAGPDPGCDSGPGTMDIVSNPYPNPAAESIALPKSVESASLINDKGRVVRGFTPGAKIDVRDLPDGLYNLQMKQNGKHTNQRIQVKH